MQCVSIASVILFYLVCFSDAGCPNGFRRFGTQCYYFSRSDLTWTSAYIACNILGGYLVEIDDSNENQYITGKLKGNNHWIRLNDRADEGIWVWTHTNERVNWTNWSPGEPNNGSGKDQHCGQIYTSGLWDDLQCGKTRRYICEADA